MLKRIKGAVFALAVVTAALFPALTAALLAASCGGYFPLDEPLMALPSSATRTLISVTPVPGADPGDYTLTLTFDGEVAGLDKADISLTPAGADCLVSKQGTIEAAGQPGSYTLKIGAVTKGQNEVSKPVTVQAGGQKADGTILKGSVTVDITFQPLANSRYKIFTLAEAQTDGRDSPPLAPDTMLTLVLTAASASDLPDIQDANDILISPLTEKLTMSKGAVTGKPLIPGPPASQIWELAVSNVSKTGWAKIEVSIDGYIQNNVLSPVQFHSFAINFTAAEEEVQENSGTGTKVLLTFDSDIPSGLTAANITMTPPVLSVTGVTHAGPGTGQYHVEVSWGLPSNWKHEAEISIYIDEYTVLTPLKRQLFLSMKKADTPLPGAQLQPAPGTTLPQLALRRVPGGKFKRDGQDDTISHLKKEYWMGETEVTNKLWKAVMGYSIGNDVGDNFPVNEVTWIEAIVFCNRLSLMEGREPVYNVNISYSSYNTGTGNTTAKVDTPDKWKNFKVGTGFQSADSDWPSNLDDWINLWIDYPATLPADIPCISYGPANGPPHHYEVQHVSRSTTANGYRLPTHQQWIWAAMGADMSPGKLDANGVNISDKNKPFAGYNGNNDIADYVWFADNTGFLKEVGTKKPNELGIYDMSGNILEWCYDQWDPSIPRFIPPGPPVYFMSNPMGDDEHYFAGHPYKVIKGGSVASEAAEMSFGFYARHIRKVDGWVKNEAVNPEVEDGLRVMRWVQPGE